MPESAFSLIKAQPSALIDHPQIPLIIDSLCRQERHHVALLASTSEKMSQALLIALAEQVSSENIPRPLQRSSIVYCQAAQLLINPEQCHTLDGFKHPNQRTILVIDQIEPLLMHGTIGNWLRAMLSNDQWRFIVLTHKINFDKALVEHLDVARCLVPISLNEPTANEMIAMLTHLSAVIEKFHGVILPSELFPLALTLANRYLAGHSTLDKALELLDSAAAHASATNFIEAAQTSVVTIAHLMIIVSRWTLIPTTHLQHEPFHLAHFSESIQQNVFGQEAAVHALGYLLQNACTHLNRKTGPLCTVMLAGPAGSGKTQLARALSRHLFGHPNALLRVNLHKNSHSLDEINVVFGAKEEHCMNLLAAAAQMPYAILFIPNADRLPTSALQLFNTILTQGYAIDSQGNKYNFRHTILVMTTTVGAERVVRLIQSKPSHETSTSADLLQIVLSENVNEASSKIQRHLSPREIYDEIMPAITAHFSPELLRYLTVIPFIPLDYAAFEKIIRGKLKLLSQDLKSNFDIELQYAPEIVKFLAHEVVWQSNTRSLGIMLEQHLYACVAHEILANAETIPASKRLLLQLNDDGQLLRCHFAVAKENLAS